MWNCILKPRSQQKIKSEPIRGCFKERILYLESLPCYCCKPRCLCWPITKTLHFKRKQGFYALSWRWLTWLNRDTCSLVVLFVSQNYDTFYLFLPHLSSFYFIIHLYHLYTSIDRWQWVIRHEDRWQQLYSALHQVLPSHEMEDLDSNTVLDIIKFQTKDFLFHLNV